MMSDREPREPKSTAPPEDLREDPDWFEAIGDEDESDEVIAENLEEYGFNQMDEGNFESDPVGPSDMPDWTRYAVYGEDQPLIDEEDELDDMDEIAAADDEADSR